MNDADARLRHPWLRINRVLRAMLHERWSAEAWSESSSRRRSARRVVQSKQVDPETTFPDAVTRRPATYRRCHVFLPGLIRAH
jgi:hypothetical protein